MSSPMPAAPETTEVTKNKKLNFKLFQKVYIKDLEAGKVLNSADYTTMGSDENGPFMLQFDLDKKDEKKKTFNLKKGFFRLEYNSHSLTAKEIEAQKDQLFEQSSAILAIKKEIDNFFNGLDVYAKCNIAFPQRGMLLHSPPGVGKTSTIAKVATDYIASSDTCVMIWPSDVVEPEDLKDFLSSKCNWEAITQFILVVEDLGGGSDIYGAVHSKVPASLLNFLDGLENVFKKPTFIISTTNNPDAFLDSLTSRPGRFDIVMGLPLPKGDERLGFLKFFAGKYYEDLKLTEDDEKRFIKLSDGFAAAHLKECYIRAMLNKKSILEIAKEIQEWIVKVREGKLKVKEKKDSGVVGFSKMFEEEDD